MMFLCLLKSGNGAYESFMRITTTGTTFQRIILLGKHGKGKDQHLLSEASSEKINPIPVLESE